MDLPREALALIAALHLGWHARQAWLGHASDRWPTVRGTMLQCYLDDSALADDPRQDTGFERVHRAHVAYAYQVDGQAFRARRLTYRPTRGPLLSPPLARLPTLMVGREIDVRHDPRQPKRSVLIPGASRDNAARCLLAAALLALAVWFAFAA